MKIVLVGGSSELFEWVQGIGAESGAPFDIVRQPGRLPELSAAVEREQPQVAIADVRGMTPADMDGLRHTCLAHPETSVMLVTEDTTTDFLLHALRIGVREVLAAPAAEDSVRQAFARVRERMTASRRRNAKIIAFMPAKGGSGGTFLSTNLAYALSQQGKRVALIDLNLQFGDAILFVSEINPTLTIADVCRQVQRLDASLLASSMTQVSETFHVLAAPETPEDALEVNGKSMRAIIDVARASYDFLVLDIGRTLDGTSIQALDQADTVYVVLQLTLPFLRDAKRLMGAFRTLDYPRDKIKFVVNRYQRGGDLDLSHVEKALGIAVSRTIPNSFGSVAASINHGVPIIRAAPRDAVAKSILEWSAELAPGEQIASARGWLRSLVDGVS